MATRTMAYGRAMGALFVVLVTVVGLAHYAGAWVGIGVSPVASALPRLVLLDVSTAGVIFYTCGSGNVEIYVYPNMAREPWSVVLAESAFQFEVETGDVYTDEQRSALKHFWANSALAPRPASDFGFLDPAFGDLKLPWGCIDPNSPQSPSGLHGNETSVRYRTWWNQVINTNLGHKWTAEEHAAVAGAFVSLYPASAIPEDAEELISMLAEFMGEQSPGLGRISFAAYRELAEHVDLPTPTCVPLEPGSPLWLGVVTNPIDPTCCDVCDLDTECPDYNSDCAYDWLDLMRSVWDAEKCTETGNGTLSDEEIMLAVQAALSCFNTPGGECGALEEWIGMVNPDATPDEIGDIVGSTVCVDCETAPPGGFPLFTSCDPEPEVVDFLAYFRAADYCDNVDVIGGPGGVGDIVNHWVSCDPSVFCDVIADAANAASNEVNGRDISTQELVDILDGGPCDPRLAPEGPSGPTGSPPCSFDSGLTPDADLPSDPSQFLPDPGNQYLSESDCGTGLKAYVAAGVLCASQPGSPVFDATSSQYVSTYLGFATCPQTSEPGSLCGQNTSSLFSDATGGHASPGDILVLNERAQCFGGLPTEPTQPASPAIPPTPDPPADPQPHEGTEEVADPMFIGDSENCLSNTANPVDFRWGHKRESVVDLRVSVPGADFSLNRSYTSAKDVYANTAGGMLGHNWWLDAFTFLEYDEIVTPLVAPLSIRMHDMGGVGTLARDSLDDPPPGEPYVYTPLNSASTQGIRFVPNSRIAVREVPGVLRMEYYFEDPLNPLLNGLPKVCRDVYGNARHYRYEDVRPVGDPPGGVSGGSGGSPTGNYVRLAAIDLQPFGATAPVAEVRFNWETGLGPLDEALGWLRSVEVWRYSGGSSPTKTQEVHYTYQNGPSAGEWNYNQHTGSLGDLIQVEHRMRIDPSPESPTGWYSAFTQYRYHDGVDEVCVDEDDDGFIEQGALHQLKCVIRSEQIEYAHQLRSQDSNALIPVSETAEWLLAADDGETVYVDIDDQHVPVMELAAKVIMYDDASGRVTSQHLKTGCGCSGGGTFGLKFTYDYFDWDITVDDVDGGHTMRVTEFRDDVEYRRRYYDTVDVVSAAPSYRRLIQQAIGETDGSVWRYWVTGYEYFFETSTDRPRLLTRVVTPAAMTSYQPSDADDDPPTYAYQLADGLIYDFEYAAQLADDLGGNYKRRARTLINGELVQEIIYPNANTGTDRFHLPTSIIRHPGDTQTVLPAETLTLQYTFLQDPDAPDAVESIAAFVGAETPAQNGPSAIGQYQFTTKFDAVGNMIWSQSADTALTHCAYDPDTGGLIAKELNVADPNPALSSPFLNGNRNGDGGSLRTEILRDDLGRVTAIRSPNGIVQRVVRQLRANPMRPGIPYYAEVSLPHAAGTGSEFSSSAPATITWHSAGGLTLGTRAYQVVEASGGEFDGLFANSVGFEFPHALGDDVARSAAHHHLSGLVKSVDRWHSLEEEGEGGGVYTTQFEYDDLGRLAHSIAANGTVHAQEYDVLNRVTRTLVGTDPNALDVVSELSYDGEEAAWSNTGNGSVTKVIESRGISGGGGGTGGSETLFTYDVRDRLKTVRAETAPFARIRYDNLDRVVESELFSNWPLDITERVRVDTYDYSARGMLYRESTRVSPGSPSLDSLDTNYWFDAVGRVVGVWAPNAPGIKTTYDGLGRVSRRYVTSRGGDLDYASVTDGLQSDLAGDWIFEEAQYRYVDAPGTAQHGLPDLVTNYLRAHDTEITDTGALSSLTSEKSVVTYQGAWYDDHGRLLVTEDFGTNDTTEDRFRTGASVPVVSQAAPPDTTAGRIISKVLYGAFGLVDGTVDPLGRETGLVYDDLFRTIATIENQTPQDPIDVTWNGTRWAVAFPSSPANDQNRVTSYVYNGVGAITKQVAHLPGAGGVEQVQETEYIYDAANDIGSGGESAISTHDLVTQIIYPDETTGTAGLGTAYARDFAYNRQGELIYTRDQNGTTHRYTRDQKGRVVRDDAVPGDPEPGHPDIDDTVVAITYAFDDAGRPTRVTSLDDVGQVYNEVEFTYTDLWQVDNIYQSVRGPVDPMTTPVVSHSYTTQLSASPGGAYGIGNWTRKTGMSYPYGGDQTIFYGYPATPTDRASQVRRIESSGAVLYDYVGVAMPAVVDLVDPDVQLDRQVSHAGARVAGEYAGWDRFGRVSNHMWVDGDFTEHAISALHGDRPPIVELNYAYDEASNVLHRFDTRPGVTWADRDLAFQYDELHRLKTATRGSWNGTTLTPSAGSQQWDLDMLGNQLSFATDLDGDGLFTGDGEQIEQTTTPPNFANEIEALTIVHNGSNVTLPYEYDQAGNMVEEGLSGGGGAKYVYTHDAWNRLVKVEYDDGMGTVTTRAEYEYNGLHWRTVKEADIHGDANPEAPPDGAIDQRRVMFYDANWRIVEEWIDDATPFDAGYGLSTTEDRVMQYVWGIRALDDLVLRQESSDLSDDSGGTAVTYESVSYHLTDVNNSPVVIIDDSGEILERLHFDPYGTVHHYRGRDMDGDGAFTNTDRQLIYLRGVVQTTPLGDPLYHSQLDIDRNGVIDVNDFNLLTGGFIGGGISDQPALPAGWLSAPDVDNVVGYAGYVFAQETGDYVVRFRWFDPGTGRWLERDPLGYVDGGNLYGYVSGRPITQVDPFGLVPAPAGARGSKDDDGNWVVTWVDARGRPQRVVFRHVNERGRGVYIEEGTYGTEAEAWAEANWGDDIKNENWKGDSTSLGYAAEHARVTKEAFKKAAEITDDMATALEAGVTTVSPGTDMAVAVEQVFNNPSGWSVLALAAALAPFVNSKVACGDEFVELTVKGGSIVDDVTPRFLPKQDKKLRKHIDQVRWRSGSKDRSIPAGRKGGLDRVKEIISDRVARGGGRTGTFAGEPALFFTDGGVTYVFKPDGTFWTVLRD